MIQKPRRGWWYLPGGKVERHETWPEAAVREVAEETGLSISAPSLCGVYHLTVAGSGDAPQQLRTIVQFTATCVEGTMFTKSKEGQIALISEADLPHLEMDAGDSLMVKHALYGRMHGLSEVFFGRFTYTFEHELLSASVHPDVLGLSTERD